MSLNDSQALLEALDADADLGKLEEEFDRFNIFEAVGMVRHELRHSNFLAFLLDPQQKHGLGDVFVKHLLKHALTYAQKQELAEPPSISLDDLNAWDFSQLEVKREWENIDIFLIDRKQKVTVTIENKVDSPEGEGQLKSYREKVENTYPKKSGGRNLFVYLTRPDSHPPTDGYYIHIHYGAIIHCLEDILQGRSNSPTSEIDILIRHYVALLRKLGMDKSTVDLCDRVYKRHRQAIDLIVKSRSNQLRSISTWLQDLMRPDPVSSYLEPDVVTPNNIRFCVKEWDAMIPREGSWTSSRRMLLFVFDNYWPKPLNLVLAIGPGSEEIRQKLSKLAGKSPFLDTAQKWGTFIGLYGKSFLTEDDYQSLELDGLQSRITAKWEEFLKNDLPKIMSAVKSQWTA